MPNEGAGVGKDSLLRYGMTMCCWLEKGGDGKCKNKSHCYGVAAGIAIAAAPLTNCIM